MVSTFYNVILYFKLLSRRHFVIFGKNLKSYAKALQQNDCRSFSSQGSGDKRHPHAIVLLEENTDGTTVWPDPSLGLLGPKDLRMPLPGNVGFSHRLSLHLPSVTLQSRKNTLQDTELLSSLTNYERQYQVVKQSTQEEDELNSTEIEEFLLDLPQSSEVLECVAQECPKLVRKDFADLFPSRDVSFGPLTVVTLAQKTKSDMSEWSEVVEYEREELVACFVDAAKEICEQLQNSGYWSDFIDPSSGRPYLGNYTNATLFETDERYRHLGFSIEDLGCCKIIRHGTWGTHAFVGCIFTNAPFDSNTLQDALRNQRMKN
uniref:Methylmalonic aciduria and homocystinuria type D protein, mitochondrial n=1 Tax=Daphnia magna TaxID=35525 RepID=A0A0P5X744_9CRUS